VINCCFFLFNCWTEHSLKHTGEYPLQCEICGYKAAFKSRLAKHIATHTSIKKFQCTICSKAFAIEPYLRRHVRSVHAKKGEITYKRDDDNEDYDTDEDDEMQNDNAEDM